MCRNILFINRNQSLFSFGNIAVSNSSIWYNLNRR